MFFSSTVALKLSALHLEIYNVELMLLEAQPFCVILLTLPKAQRHVLTMQLAGKHCSLL